MCNPQSLGHKIYMVHNPIFCSNDSPKIPENLDRSTMRLYQCLLVHLVTPWGTRTSIHRQDPPSLPFVCFSLCFCPCNYVSIQSRDSIVCHQISIYPRGRIYWRLQLETLSHSTACSTACNPGRTTCMGNTPRIRSAI